LLLGVDDTDSLEGGCTTHVAVQLVLRLGEELGLVPLDHPRLVRLNPANPWKTRGNAALALNMGTPQGEPASIGEWGGQGIPAYPDGEEVPPSEDVLETAWKVVRDLTWREDGRTNPGLVALSRPGPMEWYTEALHRLLDVGPVREHLEGDGTLLRAEGSGRGLIGATAAIAWPGDPHTWELLAYRPRERWGKDRQLDPGSAPSIEATFPTAFDCHDPESGSLTMAPGSPCPVLYGIRGTEPEDLMKAKDLVRGEVPEGWMVFRTNQATDAHLVPKAIPEVRPHESVAIMGRVAEPGRTIQGGHVILNLEGDGASLDLAAYEPTKGFRDLIRQLAVGDTLVACGSVRDDPRTLNLEKVKLLGLGSKTQTVKTGNPRCPSCGKRMKSIGTKAGYRCLRCGTKAGEAEAVYEERPRDISLGWHEVPPGARRHLARPLKLGVRKELDEWVAANGQGDLMR
jgi:tRNA(Ile2)-agmatinylcytidine synthase